MFYINLLKMYLLGYVNIKFDSGDNFEIIKNDVIILDKEYSMIYNYIFNTITVESKLMLEEINKFVEENYQYNYFFKEWDKLVRLKLAKNGFLSVSFIDSCGDVVKKYYFWCILLFIIITIIIMINLRFIINFTYLFFYIVFFIYGYLKLKNMKIASNWSIYEHKKVMALKRFLKKFTRIEDRPLEYIKLLEDYIVYVAIFDMTDVSVKEMIDEIALFLKVCD